MPGIVLSIVGSQNPPMNSQPARMWLINTIVVYITANPPTSILSGWYTTVYIYNIHYTHIIYSLLPQTPPLLSLRARALAGRVFRNGRSLDVSWCIYKKVQMDFYHSILISSKQLLLPTKDVEISCFTVSTQTVDCITTL